MASTDEAEVRLNNVVHLVASNMEAEVCSAYFIRDRDILELFATEGLKLEAVHNTRLQVGEGLVGLVASTGASLNLSNAQEHPKFVYRPETGEESYKSMMAVPILRTGKVVGVLVLQKQAIRHYLEEEEDVCDIKVCFSNNVTLWPFLHSSQAVITPLIPPPIIAIFINLRL